MVQGIIAVMVLITMFLGVRVFMKLREMSSWKPDEDFVGGTKANSLPQDLKDLKIDTPPGDMTGLSDDGGNRHAGESDSETKPKT
jgi:hypothetical protein